uniref:Uncharacterized protein n=1 Tax=Cannabis sativa TaxID=3483 RepID=A0A803Q561_CANSA
MIILVEFVAMQRAKEVEHALRRRDEEEWKILKMRENKLFVVKRVETSEGLFANTPLGPMVNIEALEKQMAPKVGREVAPFVAELLNQGSSSTFELPLETWETCSSIDAFTLSHAVKQQVVGVSFDLYVLVLTAMYCLLHVLGGLNDGESR